MPFRLVWPDLRRAWQQALAGGDAENTCLAVRSLIPLWLDGSVLRAYDLVGPSIRLADDARTAGHSDLVFVCAQAAYTVGDFDRTGRLLDRLGRDIDLPSDPELVASTALMRGYVASNTGDLDTTEREMRRSLELLERHGSNGPAWWEGFSRTGLGWVLKVRGDREAAIGEFAAARRVGRESGNVGAEMQGLVFEADLHLAAGRRDRAAELLVSACDLVEAQPFF